MSVCYKRWHLQYHDWWWWLHVYMWYNLMEQNTPMHWTDHTRNGNIRTGLAALMHGCDYCIILQHETTGGKWVNYTSLCTTSYNHMQTYECVRIQCCFKKYRGRCLLWDTVTVFFIMVRWGPFPATTLWIFSHILLCSGLTLPHPTAPENLIFWDIFIKIWQVFEADTQSVGSMAVPEQRPVTP